MRAATFAPIIEEQIPRGVEFSPAGSVSEASVNFEELKNLAGRTPHTRKTEAERNVNLLKQSLMMSAAKPLPMYYDSPMSVVPIADKEPTPTARDENVHPNSEKRGSSSKSSRRRADGFRSPQKFGSAAGKAFTFLPSDATPQSTGWTPVPASMRSTPAMPMSGFTPSATMPSRPQTAQLASATVSSIKASPSSFSVAETMANSPFSSAPTHITANTPFAASPVQAQNASSPAYSAAGTASEAGTPFAASVAQGSVSRTNSYIAEGIAGASFHTSPQHASPAAAVEAEANVSVHEVHQPSAQNSPGQLWALLTDGSTTAQSTPGSQQAFSPTAAANTTHNTTASNAGELWAMLTNDAGSVDGTPVPAAAPAVSTVRFETVQSMETPVSQHHKSAAYQKPQTPFMMAAPSPSSALSSRHSSPGDGMSVMSAMSPLTVVPEPTPAASPAVSVAPVAFSMAQASAEKTNLASPVSASPKAVSVAASPAAAPASVVASPAGVMGIAEAAECSRSTIVAPSSAFSRRAVTPQPAAATPVIMAAATPLVAAAPTPAAPATSMSTTQAVMFSPIGHFQYGSSPSARDVPNKEDTMLQEVEDEQEQDQEEDPSVVFDREVSVISIRDIRPTTPVAPQLFARRSPSPSPSLLTPAKEAVNTSVTSLSSTSTPVILGRQGGVSMGRGPSLYSTKFANVSKVQAKSPVKEGLKVNTSVMSARSPARVPVHTVENSARKPGLPRQDAASKVDRKQLAFIPRPRSNSGTSTNSAATALKSVSKVSGVSRNTKRTKNDNMKNMSVNTSYATTSTSSTASVCPTESSVLTEPQLAAEQSVSVAAMCNVSIQCDSFLMDSNSTAVAGIAALNKAQVAAIQNRASYDCFEEGLDSAMSMDGSATQQSQCAALDYSMDSTCVQTPPKTRHSPIFMSYRKVAHDSDSEDELMKEMGLEDLLAGAPTDASPIAPSPQASPIARRHSFAESTVNSIGASSYSGGKKSKQSSLQKKPVSAQWEHSFVAPVQAATTPSTASSRYSRTSSSTSSSGRSRSAPRSTSSRKSILGSAKRVSLSGEVHEHAYVYGNADSNASVSAEHSKSSAEFSGAFYQLNGTAVTDAAVTNHDVTALSENSQMFDLSMSMATTATCANTTMTLDHKHPMDSSVELSGAQVVESGPRLAVMPLKRDRDAAEDIKEVAFNTRPGEATTVMLTINNHRSKTIKLHSHAVSLRMEEYAADTVRGTSGLLQGPSRLDEADEDDALTVETACPAASFEVSPAELHVQPGQEGILYVTFTPQPEIVGVYSGALKIRTKNKAFVMLLRGKALPMPVITAGSSLEASREESQQIGIAEMSKHELDTSLFKRIRRLNANSATKASPIPEVAMSSPMASPVAAPTLQAFSPAPAQAVGSAAPSPAVPARVFATLSISPDSLVLQKSAHCARYESLLTLQLRHSDYTEVTLQASRPFIKLSRSRVIMSTDNQETIKVMLDERSEELLQLCHAILAQDAASVTTATAGFVTVNSAAEGEYTVDVSITRSACFLIRQQHQQMTQQAQAQAASAMKAIISPKSVNRSACPLPVHPSTHAQSSSKRLSVSVDTSMAHSVVDTPRVTPASSGNRAVPAYRASTASSSSRSSTPTRNPSVRSTPTKEARRAATPQPSERKSPSVDSASSVASENSIEALAATLLMLRSTGYETPSSSAALAPSTASTVSTRNTTAPSTGKSVLSSRASASSDIRNFVNAHHDFPAMSFGSSTEEVSTRTTVVAESSVVHTQYAHTTSTSHTSRTAATANTHASDFSVHTVPVGGLMDKKVGVYFRKECINFGAVAIGSLTRANIELCNATDEQVTVYLGDPMKPYVLLHNEISLRPRSYVRVPLRFLPTTVNEFHNELIAQTEDGTYHTRIQLSGSAYA